MSIRPARTTVISSVTKKINSEVVKLKTSQLLQMAGRAGRRGKDVEGTVVLMRSRFEDAKMGHKILTSKIDGIRSNFKISYSLAVKLLETKTMEECKALIERGFGSYLLQLKSQNKAEESVNMIEGYRQTLQNYTFQGAREYLKLKRRLEKEVRNLQFQQERLNESDEDLVMAIADYMPLGIGLQLKDGNCGFFLGDVRWGANNVNGGFGIILSDGNTLQIVNKEHIKAFSETEDSLSIGKAQDLLDLMDKVSSWEEVKLSGCKRPYLRGSYDKRILATEPKLSRAVDEVRSSTLEIQIREPGSLMKQKKIVDDLEKELNANPIEHDGAGELVLEALKYAVSQKDPVGFISTTPKEPVKSETFAWRMFNNVKTIMEEFGAINDTKATSLGEMVESLTGDNELWLAMVLQRPSVATLNASELGAVVCGVITDGFKASSAFFRQRPSPRVRQVMDELEQLSWELKMAQNELSIDFPIHLCREVGGMIEQWASGVSWRDLCKETSLDQGDVCRMLKRTVELLRQIPLCYGVDPTVASTAYTAANLMDRFPIADFDPNTDLKERPGMGYGATGEAETLEYDDIDEEGLFEDDDSFNAEGADDGIDEEVKGGYNLDDILDELDLR